MPLSIQEKQRPIFERIAFALVEATPEHWLSATLELIAPDETEASAEVETGCSHSIFNPEFPRDIVVPTDDLYSATRVLELLSREFADNWSRIVFKIEKVDDDWRYAAEFERWRSHNDRSRCPNSE